MANVSSFYHIQIGVSILIEVSFNVISTVYKLFINKSLPFRSERLETKPSSTCFQYIIAFRFKPSNPGTHFWHAHSGLQRADGVFGAFIVRQPPEVEPHVGFYDKDLAEHNIIINDWLVELAIDRFAAHHHATGDNKPASMLINGKVNFKIHMVSSSTKYRNHY